MGKHQCNLTITLCICKLGVTMELNIMYEHKMYFQETGPLSLPQGSPMSEYSSPLALYVFLKEQRIQTSNRPFPSNAALLKQLATAGRVGSSRVAHPYKQQASACWCSRSSQHKHEHTEAGCLRELRCLHGRATLGPTFARPSPDASTRYQLLLDSSATEAR